MATVLLPFGALIGVVHNVQAFGKTFEESPKIFLSEMLSPIFIGQLCTAVHMANRVPNSERLTYSSVLRSENPNLPLRKIRV